MNGLNNRWFYQGGESASAYTVGDFALMIYELTSNGYKLDLANAYKVGNTYVVKVLDVPKAYQQDEEETVPSTSQQDIVDDEQEEDSTLDDVADSTEEGEKQEEDTSQEVTVEENSGGEEKQSEVDLSEEDEPSVDSEESIIYTEDQLWKIAEEGMTALREIGDKFGVKNVSKEGLIKEILAVQATSV